MPGLKKIQGVIVPMVTPFTEHGKIDESATIRITEHLVRNNVSPFILGTTGESASIPDVFRLPFVKIVIKAVQSRTMVFAGISSNCLETSVELGKQYFDSGIDAVVAHLPSYYAFSDDQMLKYFECLADRLPGPLIVYNIPLTTHLSIPLKVVEKLSYHPNIIGMKDSERDPKRLQDAVKISMGRTDFSHILGWNAKMAEALLMGSDGIVPSTGNIFPKIYRTLYEAAIRGEKESAMRFQKLTDEISAVYQKDRMLGQSLTALKVIMHMMGLCLPYVLPPLTQLSSEEEKIIRKKVKELNLESQFIKN